MYIRIWHNVNTDQFYFYRDKCIQSFLPVKKLLRFKNFFHQFKNFSLSLKTSPSVLKLLNQFKYFSFSLNTSPSVLNTFPSFLNTFHISLKYISLSLHQFQNFSLSVFKTSPSDLKLLPQS